MDKIRQLWVPQKEVIKKLLFHWSVPYSLLSRYKNKNDSIVFLNKNLNFVINDLQ